MNVLEHAELEGERVRLRPLCLDDVETAFALIHGNEDILQWLIWDGPELRADLEGPYDNWITKGQAGHNYHFAILDRESEAFMGAIGPRFIDHPGTGDLGYWLGRPYWGRGYMTDAVRLTAWLCFEHLAAELLYAYVFLGNLGSRRVLERAGFLLAHTSRGHALKRGEPRDEWFFTLTRGDWERGERWRPREAKVLLAAPEPPPAAAPHPPPPTHPG